MIRFFVQAGGATTDRAPSFAAPPSESGDGSFTLEDYLVRVGTEAIGVRFGQFKTPFGRQWIASSGELSLVDRSVVTKYFTFGRDRGAALEGSHESFAWTAGLFNGGGDPNSDPGYTPGTLGTSGANVSNDSTGMLYVARVSYFPRGPAGESEGDVETNETLRIETGAGFLFDDDRAADLNGDGVLDNPSVDTWNAQWDLTLKSGGVSGQVEAFYRHVSADGGIDGVGFYVQPSYFLTAGKLEAAARFGWLDPDFNTAGDRLFETCAAINYYLFSDHREKAQLQYTWRGQDRPLGGRLDHHFIDLVFQFTI
jgi:phosphate-selective porin